MSCKHCNVKMVIVFESRDTRWYKCMRCGLTKAGKL